MGVPISFLRHQLPVIQSLVRAARATARSAGRSGGEMALPGPVLQADVPPRPAELIQAYLKVVGGNPASYNGADGPTVPPHLFPQWTFPLLARLLEDVPYDLRRVLNGGCRMEIRGRIPAKEPLHVSAQLMDVDVNERRAVLHQVITTGTISCPDAIVAHFYPIVPLARPEGGKRAPKEPVVVPPDAREIDAWRLGPKAGLDFAMVTGDFNPIHWIPLAARAAGFKSVILHGFGTMARAIESMNRTVLMGDVHRITEVDARFLRPLVLPAKPRLFLHPTKPDASPSAGPTRIAFSVGDLPGSPAYLAGTFSLGA